jgi:hypothetical protein
LHRVFTRRRVAGDKVERGLDAGFDQGEGLQRITRNQAFVAELGEPVGDVGGIKPEVFGVELCGAGPMLRGHRAHGLEAARAPALHKGEDGAPEESR